MNEREKVEQILSKFKSKGFSNKFDSFTTIARFDDNGHVVEFRHNKITKYIDEIIDNFPNLEILTIDHNMVISKVADKLVQLPHLKKLIIKNQKRSVMPEIIFELPQLEELHIIHNELDNFILKDKEFPSLTSLHLAKNKTNTIEFDNTNFPQLKNLSLVNNEFQSFIQTHSSFPKIESLNLSGNTIRQFPVSLCNLDNLKSLVLWKTNYPDLPQEIGQLKNLEYLYLSETYLYNLPDEMSQLKNLKTLIIDSYMGEELGDWISKLPAIEKLTLVIPFVEYLPNGFRHLHTMKDLILITHSKADIDPVGYLYNLEKLEVVTDTLPENFTNLTSLHQLTVNELSKETNLELICQLPKIWLLRIYHSQIEELPQCLTSAISTLIVENTNLRKYPVYFSKIGNFRLNNNKTSSLDPIFYRIGHDNPNVEINTEGSAYKTGLYYDYYSGERSWLPELMKQRWETGKIISQVLECQYCGTVSIYNKEYCIVCRRFI